MTDKILEVRGLTKTYGGVKKRGAKKADPTLDVLKVSTYPYGACTSTRE